MTKVVGFMTGQLGLRGTEVAVYDYARYNEEILGNKSFIFSYANADMSTLEKFENRFPGRVMLLGRELGGFGDIETVLLTQDGIAKDDAYFYIIKGGYNDGGLLQNVKSVVHAVFTHNDPHGYKYAYVSDWLANHMGYNPETHAVPHIVSPLPETSDDLRGELGIPHNATVFGCYGGKTEFNIQFVHEVMKQIVSERNDVYFIFMNIHNFYADIVHDHPQTIFLDGSWDLLRKSKFINTCNAMLHARVGGETFGLACAEFSQKNKPVITYGLSGERSHLEILGEKAIQYNNRETLYDILNNLNEHMVHTDWNCYRQFSPEIIMNRFNNVFLQ
jgi:hypothetical protein